MDFLKFIIFLSLYFPVILSDTEYDGPLNVHLYHNLEETNEPHWIECGVIKFQSINRGSVSFTPQYLDDRAKSKLENLAQKDMLYRLKSVVMTAKGRVLVFFSFIKACALVENDLVDLLTITLDQSGSVVRIILSTNEPCQGFQDYKLMASYLNTTIEFKTIEQGPVPDTASYIQKIEREREAKERGANQDNRSFFAKYWMYIIPVVLFAVLSGSANVDGGNGNNR